MCGAVATGRRVIEDALRTPMEAIGWRPRAAGWFTRSLSPGATGVIAVGTASKRTAPGTVDATLHIHLRVESVEAIVRSFGETTTDDGGYRAVTASTSIGYLMPAARWRDWHVTSETATPVAEQMANAVRDFGEPYLERLTVDPERLLDAIRKSTRSAQSPGLCAEVAQLAELGQLDDALRVLERRLQALDGRTDAAASDLRRLAGRLREWLSGRGEGTVLH